MLIKNYKNKVCRVTFKLPADVNAKKVILCGDFNDWDKKSQPMRMLKDGSFSATISLSPGRSYRFRYLLDNKRWENDWAADSYIRNNYGGEDSVVVV